jgi:integrase
VSEVWEQYRKLRLQPECKPATIAEHSRIFAAHIEPKLGGRDIASIDKPDCLALADAALARGFAARNKLTAVLTSFLGTWCHEERDLIAADPTRGIKQRTNKTNGNGKRAIDDAEVKVFWRACDAIDSASSTRFGAMFKLMLLTGARRNEVAGMSEAEIKGKVWTLPAARTKNGKELKVTLTKTALSILKSIPREARIVLACMLASERGPDLLPPNLGRSPCLVGASVHAPALEIYAGIHSGATGSVK